MPWCLYEGQRVTTGRFVFFFQPVGPGGANASGQALVASIFTISPDTYNTFGTGDGNQGLTHLNTSPLSYVSSALFNGFFKMYFLCMNVLSDICM